VLTLVHLDALPVVTCRPDDAICDVKMVCLFVYAVYFTLFLYPLYHTSFSSFSSVSIIT